MKISTLIKYLSEYIETYEDMDLVFNIPTVCNFYSFELVEDGSECFLELRKAKPFSNNDCVNSVLNHYCNDDMED